MAIKTFTTGEVLTAADTNTYLANSGLVFVKSQTIGAGVASQSVTGAFSSTFDNYLIQVNGGVASSSIELAMTLGATVTGYYYQYIYTTWNTTVAADAGTNNAKFPYCGFGSSTELNMSLTILSPNLAKVTRVQSAGGLLTSYTGQMLGMLNNTTQYTDFAIQPASGTMTGGTITVYGYRKA